MATENILIKFTSDTSGLKDSVAELQKIGKLSDEDAKKFQMMEGFAEGVADALKEAGIDAKTLNKEIGSTVNSGKSLKAQFSDAKNEAVKLSREFGATSVQARNAAKSAALLKDEIDDMNGVLKALNPEAKLNAFVNLGQGVQGAFQAATGALQVFGIENERITKLAQQFQGVLNVTQGINSVLQLKDVYTQLRLVLGVTTVAQEGLKAATIATTVAEEGAVVATNALNVSLKSLLVTAGPYLIILSILGVAINELNKSYEKEAKANKDSRDEIQRKRLVLIQLANDYVELANSSSKYLEIAKEEGKSELDLLQLQIDKNNERKQYLKDASKAQQEANIDNELGKNIQNEINSAIEENTLLLLKLGNEIERVALQRLVAAQSQRDIEAAATKSLKAQFDSEYQARLQVFDETLELSKIVNEIISKDASDRIKRDLVSEIDFLDKKLKETEETQKQDLANFEYYEKQKELIRAKLARTKKQLTGQEDKDDNDARKERLDGLAEFAQNSNQIFDGIYNVQVALRQREFQDLEEQKDKGLISEEQYQERLKKIKQKAAEDDKKAALFSATLSAAAAIINALNTTPTPAIPAAVALASVLSALNIARIVATPIPQFKKGTLNVGGGTLDTDGGMHAVIHKGEAIIPADQNKEYHPTIKALYNRQIKASEINAFVQNKLSGKMNHNVNAKINTKELARVFDKNKTVEIGNSKVLGNIIADRLTSNLKRRQW
jgi:hypothetical protein